MSIKFITAFSAVLFISQALQAVEPLTDEIEIMDLERLQDQIMESRDKSTDEIALLNLNSWPTSRPFPAVKVQTINSFSYRYDLYMWWHEGYLFAQAVPLGGTEAFVCGASWLIIQPLGETVTAFDTIKFENSLGSSVCDDFGFSTIFAITQWSFPDYVASFSNPFNLVYRSDPSVIVQVDGGVTIGGPSPNRGTILKNLNISIPSIELQTLGGTADIWLELTYTGDTPDGLPLWRFGNGGYND